MVDREKVIKGLECCLPPHDPDCDVCPYDSVDLRCRSMLRDDVMALLKEQVPRVMTLEELERLQEEDVIYVEIKPVRDLTCISVELVRFVEKVQKPATWIELHTTDSAGFYTTRKTTDPNWRCWTSRPDQATREATPWE